MEILDRYIFGDFTLDASERRLLQGDRPVSLPPKVFDLLVHVQIALSYWNQRNFDEAIAWADKALAIDDRHLLAREFLVGACQQKGDHDRAMAETFRHAET